MLSGKLRDGDHNAREPEGAADTSDADQTLASMLATPSCCFAMVYVAFDGEIDFLAAAAAAVRLAAYVSGNIDAETPQTGGRRLGARK
jgi:hypothetical protein